MSYQNVVTPRFYVDVLSYLNALGKVSPNNTSFNEDYMDLIGINPSNVKQFTGGDGIDDAIKYDCGIVLGTIMPEKKNFTMVLGHNFGTAEASLFTSEGEETGGVTNRVTTTGLVNTSGGSSSATISYDGFSILIGNDALDMGTNLLQFSFHYQGTGDTYNAETPLLKIGSLLYGTYYDMPNAPNLSLTMSREYGGTKEFTTYNGSSMSNTMWSKPPKWGNLGAWELSGEEGFILGDLNQDGIVNVQDAILLAGMALQDLTEEDEGWIAEGDINQDGGINVLDVVQLANIILGRSRTERDTIITPALSRSGRRTWDLKFSYMDDGDLWGSFQSLGVSASLPNNVPLFYPIYTGGGVGWESSGYEASDLFLMNYDTYSVGFNYNLLTDDNFFSQVWHKTLGGTLPFIFQPDKNNNNPDQFCIARFKDNSLKATQSAPNVYDISVSIEEVW